MPFATRIPSHRKTPRPRNWSKGSRPPRHLTTREAVDMVQPNGHREPELKPTPKREARYRGWRREISGVIAPFEE